MKPPQPHEIVADFYKGLIAQEIPKSVAIALTAEWIKEMFKFANGQANQSDALVDWLKSQNLKKE